MKHALSVGEVDPLALAGPFIIISWLLMLGLNWAQLNQSFSWVFLTLAVMPFRPVRPRKPTLIE